MANVLTSSNYDLLGIRQIRRMLSSKFVIPSGWKILEKISSLRISNCFLIGKTNFYLGEGDITFFTGHRSFKSAKLRGYLLGHRSKIVASTTPEQEKKNS
jgi:hypothetical protein